MALESFSPSMPQQESKKARYPSVCNFSTREIVRNYFIPAREKADACKMQASASYISDAFLLTIVVSLWQVCLLTLETPCVFSVLGYFLVHTALTAGQSAHFYFFFRITLVFCAFSYLTHLLVHPPCHSCILHFM